MVEADLKIEDLWNIYNITPIFKHNLGVYTLHAVSQNLGVTYTNWDWKHPHKSSLSFCLWFDEEAPSFIITNITD